LVINLILSFCFLLLLLLLLLWLPDRLRLIGWSFDWLAHWLSRCLVDRLTCSLVNWLNNRLGAWLVGWFGYLDCCLVDGYLFLLPGWLTA
jgi:hypothetical protein